MSLVALGYSFVAISWLIGKSKKNVAHCVGGFDSGIRKGAAKNDGAPFRMRKSPVFILKLEEEIERRGPIR